MMQSIQKVMLILMAISNGGGKGVSLAYISQQTSINKSTCIHILNSLIEGGFVEKTTVPKGYRLGPATYYLTRKEKFNEQLIKICQPHLEELNEKLSETVILSNIYSGRKFIFHIINGKYKISNTQDNVLIGSIYPTSTGRVILSSMDKRELNEFCEAYGFPKKSEWEGAQTKDALFEKLKNIKKEGYAFASQKTNNDFYALGFGCALNVGCKCLGAVGVSVSSKTEFLDVKRHNEIVKSLKICADKINKHLATLSQDVFR